MKTGGRSNTPRGSSRPGSPYVTIGAHGYIAVRDAERLTADEARTAAADLIRLADLADRHGRHGTQVGDRQ